MTQPSQHYDVIIIGAGLGGLTAAALLAQSGARVLVCEQHFLAGGYCTSWQRTTPEGIFTFDAAIRDVGGLSQESALYYLLHRLNALDAVKWVRLRHTYCAHSLRIDVPDTWPAYVALLAQRFPHEAAALHRFGAFIEQTYRKRHHPQLRSASVPQRPHTPEEFAIIAPMAGALGICIDTTYAQVLTLFFQDPLLKQLLSVVCYSISGTPALVPFVEILPVFSQYFEGSIYPVGSTQVLADVLVARCREAGGEVALRTPIAHITCRKGKVTGVETAQGVQYTAPWVISNADVIYTMTQLIEPTHLPADMLARYQGLIPATSAFITYLGIRGPSEVQGVLIDPSVGSISSASHVDPTLAPPGYACVSLTQFIPSRFFPSWNRASPVYKKRRKYVGDHMLQAAQTHLPNLPQRIVYRQDATPATFARYTGATRGSIYGIERGQWIPPMQTPIGGLLLAGSGVLPGPGVEAVVNSGTVAADVILAARGQQP